MTPSKKKYVLTAVSRIQHKAWKETNINNKTYNNTEANSEHNTC